MATDVVANDRLLARMFPMMETAFQHVAYSRVCELTATLNSPHQSWASVIGQPSYAGGLRLQIPSCCPVANSLKLQKQQAAQVGVIVGISNP